jgi:UDP-GlcNAc3NAcA epimerase
MRILTIIGARPQIIKAAAVSRAVAGPFAGRITERILHTGQHYDAGMSEVFFQELGIPRPDVQLHVGSASHGEQTARMLEGIEAELLRERPDAVLLYGDTNSTLAGALAAVKLHIPVAHVEAGLRSFSKSMPEEVNRIVCDHCSTWLFCPTGTAMENLQREGFDLGPHEQPGPDSPLVLRTGDVMLDNSRHFAALAAERSRILEGTGVEPGHYVLATVHRDHNTDQPLRLNAIIGALLDLAAEHGLPVVLPVHPRTRKCMDAHLEPALRDAVASGRLLKVIPPAGFLDIIALEDNARLVATDSGGVQKEAWFFGKPCIVLRPNTEWVELLQHGQAILADADRARILQAARDLLGRDALELPALFGDGRAAEHICAALLGDPAQAPDA